MTQQPPYSALASNLRTLVRRGEMEAAPACNRIKFADGSIEAALDLAREVYDRTPTPALLQLIGEYHVNLGHRIEAQALFRACEEIYGGVHVTNLIYAELPKTRAIVDDEARILYVPIPKCGSSTVKNYLTHCIHGATYGEFVHFHHPELYRSVTAEDLATSYAEYARFTVVRDPVSRLVSYFMMNVSTRALRREAHGQGEFMGLSTAPGPRQVARDFHAYRQFFIDFRHHTDPISGYIGTIAPHLDHVYQMRDLPEIRAWLSDLYGKEIPDQRSMVSQENDETKALCETEFEAFRGWYAKDADYLR